MYSVKKSTCFGHLLCPSSGVFYCTFGISKYHAGLMTASKQSQDGTAVPVFKTLLHSDKYVLHLLQYSKFFVLSPQFIYVLILNVRTDKNFG